MPSARGCLASGTRSYLHINDPPLCAASTARVHLQCFHIRPLDLALQACLVGERGGLCRPSVTASLIRVCVCFPAGEDGGGPDEKEI